ncbi:MAG TPA: hypothetical protein VMB75_00720, partial [Rhodocyclaceae bacterium]|nr:hypothetical protein [Rhodocyclaceae bacterium]
MRISLTRLGGLLCLLALAFAAQAEIAVDGDSSLKLAQSLPAPPQLAPDLPAPTTQLVPPPPTAPVPLAPPISREIRDDLPPLPTIDLTVQPDDLWQRMRNGFGMPDLQNPLVADRQAYYL